MSLSVVRAWRGLGMVLNRENRVLAVLDAFDRSVVEVKVGDLQGLRAWDAARFPPDGESVIL